MRARNCTSITVRHLPRDRRDRTWPMAGVLVIQPTNLTQLADEEGVFPTARVVARIDGARPLVSHGSPMPVYGPYFEGQDTAMKTPEGQPILTSQPIVDLVAYLKTLQGLSDQRQMPSILAPLQGITNVPLAALFGQWRQIEMHTQHVVQASFWCGPPGGPAHDSTHIPRQSRLAVRTRRTENQAMCRGRTDRDPCARHARPPHAEGDSRWCPAVLPLPDMSQLVRSNMADIRFTSSGNSDM